MRSLFLALASLSLSACAALPPPSPGYPVELRLAVGAEEIYSTARTAVERAAMIGLIHGDKAVEFAKADSKGYALLGDGREKYDALGLALSPDLERARAANDFGHGRLQALLAVLSVKP